MANKTIPVEDKQLVLDRLAQGMSTRQAIEGTAIASNKTAALMAKDQLHIITQLRANYVKQIEKYSEEGQTTRAAMLADMLYANKHVRRVVPRYQRMGEYGPWTEYGEDVVEVPDWELRLKVIKYIDQLAGFAPMDGTHINVVQQVRN